MNLNRRKFLGLALVTPWAVRAAAENAVEQNPSDLNGMLSGILSDGGVPALAAGAMKSGKLLGVGALGLRKTGAKSTVTLADKFHLGSDTKAMTATLAAMLVEEGKLEWGRTLAEVFPERAAKMNEGYRKVTLEMLLTHYAGTPHDGPNNGEASQYIVVRRLIYMDALINEPPATGPGEGFAYSNAGYIIVGAVLERITGKAWEFLIRERIFRPFGMHSAGFGSPSKPNGTDQPWGHIFKNGKFEPSYGDNSPTLGPAGTVHCSISDYLKFADFHASGGKRPAGLLKPESVRKLQTPQPGRAYAMGWATGHRDWAKGGVLTHTGSNTKNFFVVWIAPRIGLSIAVACNAAGGRVAEVCDKVASKLVRQFAG